MRTVVIISDKQPGQQPGQQAHHCRLLDGALLEHCGGDFHEAGDVGALHVVYAAVRLGSVLHSGFVDGLHDEVQLGVNLLSAPADVGSVLSHLKT